MTSLADVLAFMTAEEKAALLDTIAIEIGQEKITKAAPTLHDLARACLRALRVHAQVAA